MDRGVYVKGRGYRTASIALSVAMMIIAGVWEPSFSFVLFPVYAFCLFYYVYKAMGRFCLIFLSFLITTMVMEIVFLYDYRSYASLVSLLSVASCIFLLLLMKPIITSGSRVFSRHYMVEFIVGFIGVGFVMGYLAYTIIPAVPDTALFLLALLFNGITFIICFIIPSFNKHPDNVSLFAIGGGFVAELAFAFIYEFIFDEKVFLLISIFMGSFVKIILATYLTKIEKIKNDQLNEDYV